MSEFFKKLLKWGNFRLVKPRAAVVEETEQEQLLAKLLEMVQYANLNALFYNPASKLLVLNTYTADFNDLTTNLYNNNFRKQIIAINVHSYFLNSKVDIQSDMEKIVKCLKTHQPNMLLRHDLFEFVTAFEYLKSLGI